MVSTHVTPIFFCCDKNNCVRNELKGEINCSFSLYPIIYSSQLVGKHNIVAGSLQHKGAHLKLANWEAEGGARGGQEGGQEEQSPFKGRPSAFFLQPGPPSFLRLLRDKSIAYQNLRDSVTSLKLVGNPPAPLLEPMEDILNPRDLFI